MVGVSITSVEDCAIWGIFGIGVIHYSRAQKFSTPMEIRNGKCEIRHDLIRN